MNTSRLVQTFFGLLVGLMMSTAAFADWKYYETKEYGFSMLLPAGAKLNTKEWGGGWGGMNSNYDGVKFYGLAKLGARESDADIEKFAVNLIGIPASAWIKTDQGTNVRGWERSYVFKANVGSRLIFGMYGVGKKGNYLLYLDTTPGDYMEHKTDYDKWYESIRLD